MARNLARWAIGAGLALAGGAAATALTPRPGARLIRALFDADAARTTAALAVGAPAKVTVTRGVVYDRSRGLAMDVYRPASAAAGQALPTVIWTHGGAWLSGARTDYAGYYRRIAAAGYTVVSLDYSLAPAGHYPAALQDLTGAHAFLLTHASGLGVDADRIALAGDSAGAQLSAQLAALTTAPDSAAVPGVTAVLGPEQLRAVVLFCGIYDVPALLAGGTGIAGWGLRQALWAYTGRRDPAGTPVARQMSTLRHLGPGFPPAFVSGGDADPLTAGQSVPLVAALTAAEVPVHPLFFDRTPAPGLGHEYQFDLSTPQARRALVELIDFLDHRLAGAVVPAGR